MALAKKDKLLLHICCAGCGAFVSQVLKEEYDVSLFYYNPNIYSQEEYEKRKENVEKIAEYFSLPLFFGKYDHDMWLEKIKGHEKDREKGERCFVCYADRINMVVTFARDNNFSFCTTTLTISPHKVAKKILEIGRIASDGTDTVFLERDFKKQDGFKKSVELSRKLGLYRQNYCGCEFSLRS
jgi:epoxyqueuosine reductase